MTAEFPPCRRGTFINWVARPRRPLQSLPATQDFNFWVTLVDQQTGKILGKANTID